MTSPPVTALVTLPDVKDHLNIAQSDTSQDAELQGFINAATVFIQNKTGPIIPTPFTEVHSGGNHIICLWNPPVLSVQSVVEYIGPTAYTLTQVDLTDEGGAYAFSLDDPKSGIIRRRYNGNLVGPFAAGDHNVVVTYTAGAAAVSADVRMAVLQDIAGLYQPSQLGSNPYFKQPDAGNAPLNPIGMFPRVAEILSAEAMRTPSIA